mgnify:CR=1 FL=1
MHELEAALVGQTTGFGFGIAVRISVEHHLGTAGSYRIHFDVRGGDGHHDHRLALKFSGGESHPLCVVPG